MPAVIADVRLDDAADLLDHVGGGGERGALLLQQLGHDPDHDVGEDLLLGPDVVVQSGRLDAEGGGDMPHGGAAVAAHREQLGRGGFDLGGRDRRRTGVRHPGPASRRGYRHACRRSWARGECGPAVCRRSATKRDGRVPCLSAASY